MASPISYLTYYRTANENYPSGMLSFPYNADLKYARVRAAELIRSGAAVKKALPSGQVFFNSSSQAKHDTGEGIVATMTEINGTLYYEGSSNILYIVNPITGDIRKSPIQRISDIIKGTQRVSKASKPLAPPKKPVKASKPVKAAPKQPVSVAKPGTLVAVVDGKFAPVNGFRYPKTEIKALVKSMDSVYARMYDGELDDTQWVPIGDVMLKNNPRLVAAVACERQDLLTSDREVAAFAYAVYHAKNRDRLMAMDRPAKPRTPKTKRPTTAQMTFNPRTGKVGTTRRF